MILDLPEGGQLEYIADFLQPDEARRVRAELDGIGWERRAIVMFGKEVYQPRLVAWAGFVPYAYSGQTLEPKPFPPVVEAIRARVAEAAGAPFNHVLGNLYRDERDSIGFHSDNEPELGRNPTVATLSFGATRRFLLMPKRKGLRKYTFGLTEGSLLVMRGACQDRYVHGIPKETMAMGSRTSLTFRVVKGRSS